MIPSQTAAARFGRSEQQHELLAAVTRGDVAGLSRSVGDQSGDRPQSLVALCVAVAVVVRLEVVDVDHRQREAVDAGLPRPRQRPVQSASVGDARQRVFKRLAPQFRATAREGSGPSFQGQVETAELLLCPSRLGDVDDVADHTPWHTARVRPDARRGVQPPDLPVGADDPEVDAVVLARDHQAGHGLLDLRRALDVVGVDEPAELRNRWSNSTAGYGVAGAPIRFPRRARLYV